MICGKMTTGKLKIKWDAKYLAVFFFFINTVYVTESIMGSTGGQNKDI